MTDLHWRALPAPAPLQPPTGSRLASLFEQVSTRGRCRTVGNPDWFIPSNQAVTFQGTARATLVCAGCPVQDECLEYAVGIRAREGVWGAIVASANLRPPEAFARVAAGQPLREAFLEEALRAAAHRNVTERVDATVEAGGVVTRSQQRAMVSDEIERLRACVADGSIDTQHLRDNASWEQLPGRFDGDDDAFEAVIEAPFDRIETEAA